MILENIYVYPDLVEFDQFEYLDEFRYSSRFVCNYLQRGLKEIKFEAEGFNQIGIIGTKEPKQVYVDTSKNLVITFCFEEKDYLTRRFDLLPEYFCELIFAGVTSASHFCDLPIEYIKSSLEEFADDNYINEWVVGAKMYNNFHFKFLGSMDMSSFRLVFSAFRTDEKFYSEVVLETKPDEIFFEKELGKVLLDKNKIVLKDKSGLIIFEKNLDILIRSLSIK